MKTGQLIPEKVNPTIVICDDLTRSIADCSMLIMSGYCWHQLDEISDSHKQYIDALFCVVDFLYKYQDLEPIYFGLLDHAVIRLKILLAQDINKKTVAIYLEKAAIIFQTASDKTRLNPEHERIFYQKLWKNKAQQYSQEALEICGQQLTVTHNERMRDLYKAFAEVESVFTKDLLLERYQEYREKCEIATTHTTLIAAGAAESFFTTDTIRHRHGHSSTKKTDEASSADVAEVSPFLQDKTLL